MDFIRHTDLPPTPDKLTKRERLDRAYFYDALMQTEYDILYRLYLTGGIPDEWHEIVHDRDSRNGPTVKITMRVDANVVKFFKGLGDGYQNRMNRVLKAFVHGRLSRMVNGPDTSDFVLRPEKVMEEVNRRREWGETEDMERGR